MCFLHYVLFITQEIHLYLLKRINPRPAAADPRVRPPKGTAGPPQLRRPNARGTEAIIARRPIKIPGEPARHTIRRRKKAATTERDFIDGPIWRGGAARYLDSAGGIETFFSAVAGQSARPGPPLITAPAKLAGGGRSDIKLSFMARPRDWPRRLRRAATFIVLICDRAAGIFAARRSGLAWPLGF